MRMSDVRVGMHLRPIDRVGGNTILVTELTERGFKYSIHPDEEIIHAYPARYQMSTLRDGHEHFGLNGKCLFEPMPASEPIA